MGFNVDCYGSMDEAIEPIFPYKRGECDVYLFDPISAEGEQVLAQWNNGVISRAALRFHAERLKAKLTHYSECWKTAQKL
jgi:hypothetical protein